MFRGGCLASLSSHLRRETPGVSSGQKIAPHTQRLVGDTNGLLPICHRTGQSANGVDILRDDDGLVVNLVGVVDFVAVYREHIFPHGHFPHIAPRPAQVLHQLDGAVEGYDAVAHPNERNPRRSAEGRQHFFTFNGARQFHHPVVVMRLGVGGFGRNGHHIEVRGDGLRIRPLVAGNVALRHDRIHNAAVIRFPGVGRPAD